MNKWQIGGQGISKNEGIGRLSFQGFFTAALFGLADSARVNNDAI
jgi:hypothetical protein